MMKYKHDEIQVGTVMIGASHVYSVNTVDTSDCGQVQTCAQSDVLTKHGEMQCNVWGIFYNILSVVQQPLPR